MRNSEKRTYFLNLTKSVRFHKSIFSYFLIFLAYLLLAVIHTYPMILNLNDQTPVRHLSIIEIYLLAEQSKSFLVENPFNLYKAFSPSVGVPLEGALFLNATNFIEMVQASEKNPLHLV